MPAKNKAQVKMMMAQAEIHKAMLDWTLFQKPVLQDSITMKQHPNLTIEEQFHTVSRICDAIRAKSVTPEELTFLNEYGPPKLKDAVHRYILLRNAGVEP